MKKWERALIIFFMMIMGIVLLYNNSELVTMGLEFFRNVWDFMALEKPLIFGTSTIILAIFVVILDFGTYYLLDRKSFLNITYNVEDLSPNKIRFYYFIFFYVICAGIVGFFAVIINMLNYNIQAVLLTCLGWPNVLSRVISQTAQKADTEPNDNINRANDNVNNIEEEEVRTATN